MLVQKELCSLETMYPSLFPIAKNDDRYRFVAFSRDWCEFFQQEHHEWCPTFPKIPHATVLPLSAAYDQYDFMMGQQREALLAKEKDVFALANLQEDNRQGSFAYFPENFVSDEVLTWDFSIASHTCVFPKNYLFLGKGAKVNICIKAFFTAPALLNDMFIVQLEENAELQLIFFDDVSSHGYHFSSLRSRLKTGAKLSVYSYGQGGKQQRRDIHVALLGERAQASLRGFSWVKEQKQTNTFCVVEHMAPHTISYQKFTSVLFDHARSSFEGLIHVKKGASETNAYQLSQNFLIDENTKAFAKPNLEIFQDDVKASHGTTMSRFSTEQLLYCMMRGISPSAARNLLLRSHFLQILEESPHYIHHEMKRYYDL